MVMVFWENGKQWKVKNDTDQETQKNEKEKRPEKVWIENDEFITMSKYSKIFTKKKKHSLAR